MASSLCLPLSGDVYLSSEECEELLLSDQTKKDGYLAETHRITSPRMLHLPLESWHVTNAHLAWFREHGNEFEKLVSSFHLKLDRYEDPQEFSANWL